MADLCAELEMGHRLLKRESPIWDSKLGNMVQMGFKSESEKMEDADQLDRDEVKGDGRACLKEGEGRAKSRQYEMGRFVWSTTSSVAWLSYSRL